MNIPAGNHRFFRDSLTFDDFPRIRQGSWGNMRSEGRLIYALGNGQWDTPKLRERLEDILPENKVISDFEATHSSRISAGVLCCSMGASSTIAGGYFWPSRASPSAGVGMRVRVGQSKPGALVLTYWEHPPVEPGVSAPHSNCSSLRGYLLRRPPPSSPLLPKV